MELLAITRLKAIVRGVQWPEGDEIEMRPTPYGDHRPIPYPVGCEMPIQQIVLLYNNAYFDARIKNARDYVLRKYRGKLTGEQLDQARAYHQAHKDLFSLHHNSVLSRVDMQVILDLLEQAGLAKR